MGPEPARKLRATRVHHEGAGALARARKVLNLASHVCDLDLEKERKNENRLLFSLSTSLLDAAANGISGLGRLEGLGADSGGEAGGVEMGREADEEVALRVRRGPVVQELELQRRVLPRLRGLGHGGWRPKGDGGATEM